MPTYEYHCPTCARNFDVVQGFHDDPVENCPTCGSPVRKVFGNVGIVFKGSGFYKTDSRTSGNGTKHAAAGETGAPAATGSDPAGGAGDGGAAVNGTGGNDTGGTGNGTGTAAPAKVGAASGSGSSGSGSASTGTGGSPKAASST